MKNRSGKFVQNLSDNFTYKSFKPAPLPPNPQIEINNQILDELLGASKKNRAIQNLRLNFNLSISFYLNCSEFPNN